MKKHNQEPKNRLHRFVFMAAAAVVLGAGAPAALANSGGGGGGLPSAPTGPQVDPAEAFRKGVEALEAGDYRTAEKRFKEVLSVAPKHPEANYYMGLAKVGRDKDKASVRHFKRAFKERPDFIEAREQLALVYIRLEKLDEANDQLAALNDIKANCENQSCNGVFMTRLDEAIAKVEAALGVGEAGAGDEDAEDAGVSEEDVSAAPGSERFAGLLLQPRAAGVDRYREAVKLINQDRFEEAIEDLYRSQAIVGPHPDILNYLGFAHRKLGKFDEAKSYYAQALRLAPDHLGATEYLGELYLELGDMKNAKRQLARLDELCAFGCADREDLARLIDIRETVRRAGR